MKHQLLIFVTIVSCVFLFTYCQQEQVEKGSANHISKVTDAITDKVLENADVQQGDWLSYGRNYQEDRYSELSQIILFLICYC